MTKKMKADTPESPISAPGSASNSSEEKRPGSETSVAAPVSGMVDSAKQAGVQVLDQAKDQAASHADQQRQTLASGMQAVAHAFQSMGEDLRSKEQGPVAKYAAEIGEAIGGQIEQLAKHLRDRDVRQLISDAEDFARRSPAVFLASAFAVGLAASRFLKSSGPASANAPTQSPNPGPSTLGTQPALPPVSPPPSAAASSMPTGFPFDPPEPFEAQLAASLNPIPPVPAGTDPAGT